MAETIQDFLISLGYKVDDAQTQKVQKGLKENTFLAVELGKAFIHMADEVVGAAERIAKAMDELYFASQRTGASVESIKAMGYAASQLGSSGGAALSALESIAKLMATNPGGEGFIRSLGVETRQANGQLKDTGEIMSGLGKALKEMPLPTANYVGSFLGIDYKQLIAMREGMGGFEAEYKQMYAAAHINTIEAAKDSNFLMTQVRSLGGAFDVLADRITADMSRRMGNDIKQFRDLIVRNFDNIAYVIEIVAKAVLFIADIITQLAVTAGQMIGSVVHWFSGLDDGAKNLIKVFGAVIGAWWLLNAAFAMGPVGIVLALGAGILALIDDYNVWKATGGAGSLLDWSAWEAGINKAIDAIHQLTEPIRELWSAITGDLIPSFSSLFTKMDEMVRKGLELAGLHFDFHLGDMVPSFQAIVDVVKILIHELTDVIHLASALARGDWAAASAAALRVLHADAIAAGTADAVVWAAGQMGALPGQSGPGDPPPDTRTLWQRRPEWLGGLPAPASPRQPGGGRLPNGTRVAGRVAGVEPAVVGGSGVGPQFADRSAQTMERLMRDFPGLGPVGAAAMMGNFGRESALDPAVNEGSPVVPGSPGGRGWAQWTAERRDAFEQFAKDNNLNPNSDEANYQFLRHELQTSHAAALRGVMGATDIAAATRMFHDSYEGSLAGFSPDRTAFAQTSLQAYRARQGGSDPTHAPPVNLAIQQRLDALQRAGGTPLPGVGDLPALVPPVTPLVSPGAGVNQVGGPVMNQTTTVNVQGVNDPAETARRVALEQDRVNQQAARNLPGAVR